MARIKENEGGAATPKSNKANKHHKSSGATTSAIAEGGGGLASEPTCDVNNLRKQQLLKHFESSLLEDADSNIDLKTTSNIEDEMMMNLDL